MMDSDRPDRRIRDRGRGGGETVSHRRTRSAHHAATGALSFRPRTGDPARVPRRRRPVLPARVANGHATAVQLSPVMTFVVTVAHAAADSCGRRMIKQICVTDSAQCLFSIYTGSPFPRIRLHERITDFLAVRPTYRITCARKPVFTLAKTLSQKKK